jgi:Ca2+-binding RTX toxin-like protein
MSLSRMIRRLRNKRKEVASKKKRKAHIEQLEPRLLLSADFTMASATAVQDGLDQLGSRMDNFLDAQNVLNDTHIPFVVQVQQGAEGAKNVAPTLGSLFSLAVDTNGAKADGIDTRLQALDASGDGTVDAGEFIQGWLIGKANDQLAFYPNDDGTADSTQFTNFLKALDTTMTFAQPSGKDVTVELKVSNATDLTENDPLIPSADMIFGVDFTLTATQDMAIDLGTEADALKLLSYTGYISDKTTPEIPVEARLDFGFTFGVHTSGQTGSGQSLDEKDFFVRDADTLNISAESHVKASDDIDHINNGIDFNLNIGFLGATVNNATVDFNAAVKTLLIDPDSPEVLGFTTSQYGAEQNSGVVTSFNAVPFADLAHDAGFVLRIGNAGIATEVKVSDNNNNGTDLSKIVADVNTALGSGLGSVVTASVDGSDHLQFALAPTTDKPFGFANEVYNPAGVLTGTPDSGDAYPYEFSSDVSFLLSVDGAVAKLVDVRFADPAQSNIGFGASQAAILTDLIAKNDANGTGTLSSPASFDVRVTQSDGTVTTKTVTVAETDALPNPNTGANDLVADLNQALINASLDGLIKAVLVGTKIALTRVDPLVPAVSAIEIVSADSVTESAIGFAAGQATVLTLVADQSVSNPSFDDGKAATDDTAHIRMTVTTTSGTGDKVVEVAPGSMDGTALAAAIDTAFTNAGFAVDASYDSVSGKVVLKAQDASVLAFSLTTVNETIDDLVADVNRALTYAGLGTVTATTDGTQLTLTSTGSKSLEITHTLTLDAGDTYKELVETTTDKLFKPEVDPTSNITFDLPVHVTAGLNYDPANVSIVGNFSPFGEALGLPSPVARYDAASERFKLDMTKTPTIDGQDTPVGPETVAPAEHLDLVNMAEPLNFNLVTAESMVGLIKGLGSALQEIAASGLFANYDVPFAKVSWSDLLNYTNSTNSSGLIDRSLIYETGPDGIDASGAASPNDVNKLLVRVIDDKGTSDTKDDVVYLVPAFVTAQDMAMTLSYILGVPLTGAGGINANYDPSPVYAGDPLVALEPKYGVNELTYTVNLVSNGRTDVSLDKAAFEYDVTLSPFAKLTLSASAEDKNKEVSVDGFTGLSMTFGINLSPPGAVIDAGEKLSDLNGGEGVGIKGVDIKYQPAVTGEQGVRSIYGLTKDSVFKIKLDSGPIVPVKIQSEDTANNTSIWNLVADIQDAIDNAVGVGKVGVGVSADNPARLGIQHMTPGGQIQIYVDSSDPWVTELGFPNKLDISGSVAVPVAFHMLIAQEDAPVLVGRLTGDASFNVSVDGNPYQVTVPAIDTQDYTTLSYSNETGAFSAGQTITGKTSGATAKILSDKDNGSFGVLKINYVEGTFLSGELLKVGSTSIATAGLTSNVSGNNSIADLVADVNKALGDVLLQNKLGFDTVQSSPASPSPVVLTGTSAATLDLTRDLVFNLALNDGTPVRVVVDKGSYADIDALIAAVNSGLTEAGLNTKVTAVASVNRLSLQATSPSVAKLTIMSDHLASLINADFSGASVEGYRLVLTALDSTTQFSVTASGIAHSQLGLSAYAAANRADFVIHDSSGGVYLVPLDDLTGDSTVQALLNQINAVTGTAKAELGFGDTQQAAMPPDLVATNVPTPSTPYVLSDDATFAISVTKSDGTVSSGTFTVTSATTSGDTSYDDLASVISTALGTPTSGVALNGLIRVVFDGTKMKIQAVDESVRAVNVAASGTAVSEVGFALTQQTTLEVTAVNAPIPTFDLTYDAHFMLSVARVGIGTTKVEVTVPADTNADAAGLAADINAAIDAALGADVLDALVDTAGKFVLKAKDTSVYALSISTKMVEADFNATMTGLRLVDHTGGSGQFRVEAVNGSRALVTLGLFGAGNTGTQNQLGTGDPYLIEGGQIGLTHLDDRFFIRDAKLWGAMGLETPNPILGSGLFGILGVNTSLTGSEYAQFTADIKNPDTGEIGGAATLRDLFQGSKQGRLTEDATFTVTIHETTGDVSATVKVLQSETADNASLDDLVADMNKVINASALNGKIAAQVAGTRIRFLSLKTDDPLTPDDESVPFTIVAGAGAAGLGLSGTLNSGKVEYAQTIDAHSAPRYAIADPVVSKVSELAFAGYWLLLPNTFKPGMTVYGWQDTDHNGLPDAMTGDVAVVLGVNGNVLNLVKVQGTFASAGWLLDSADLLHTTVAGLGSGSAVATKSNFGHFTLGTDVQSGFNDLAFVDGDSSHGFGLLDGKHYDVGFGLTDFGNPYGNGSVTDPTAPVATFDGLPGQTGDLYAFKDLGYDDIDAALQQLLALINDVNDNFPLLKTVLPAINRSMNDLLNLVGNFDRGVTNAGDAFAAAILALSPEGTDVPALTLQNIPKALRGAFGLPSGPDTVAPAADTVNWISLDFDKADHMMLMDLSLEQTISTKLGLDIVLLDDAGLPLEDADGNSLPNLTSGGVLKVNGALDVNLNVGIDLNAPNDAYLFDTSTITGELHVEGEGQTYESGGPVPHDGMGLVFRAALGPLAVFIQDGDATIDAAFSLGMNPFGKKLITEVDSNRDDQILNDFAAPDQTPDHVEIVLPMFYGGEGPDNYLGDFSAIGTIEKVVAKAPDFSGPIADINDPTKQHEPFENILLAVDTLNVYLETLSDTIAGDILGIKLPFVSDQLADLLFIETFRNKLYTTLKNGIENDINPTVDDVTALLTTALGNLIVPGSLHYTPTHTGNRSTWADQWSFELRQDKTYTFDNFDLGISNLGFDMAVPVQVDFKWDLFITFGVNFTEGAFIDVSNANDLAMDATITLPQDGQAVLGFLKGNATDSGDDTGALVNFDVNVKNGDTDGHLGFSDLGSINADATIQGGALANASDGNADGIKDAATLHLVTTAVKGLPSLTTDLIVDWSLVAGTEVESLKGDAVTPGTHLIAFQGMSLDAKSVAQSLLGPVFDTIEDIIQPFMPLVDTLTYPIPILSDVAGKPFTLLDLAAIFGSVDPAFIDAVKDILNVIKTIDNIIELPVLPLGNLTLYRDMTIGPTQINNLKPNDPNFKIEKILVDSWDPSAPNKDVTGWDFDKGAFDAVIEGNGFLKDLRDGNLAKGLTMPIFTDARQGMKLLLDQNATMIDYLIPPLSVDFSYLQLFPIFGPLSLSITINFGFDLELHSVGFDTYGYQRYARGGFQNAAVIFDGFYLNDLNAEGADTPEITFSFGLIGAAELNLGIARAGVQGGIDAKIYFDWYDAIPDGHVHFSEMAGSVLANNYNPLAVFDVSGALTFQMSAFLEISIIGFKLPIPITPETTLYSFDIDFDRPPVLGTTVMNADGTNTLILNTGPNAKDRLNGDTSDGNESITVRYDQGSGEVRLSSTQFGAEEGNPANTFTNVSKIVGLGGQGDDTFDVYLDGSSITYEFEGGTGDDTIIVNSGGGGGTIHGGVGNDTLTGGDGDDIIWGEEGNDTLAGGIGSDIVFGDFGRVFEQMATADPLISSRVTDADGADTIHGGDGDDILIGGGGNDKIWGDAGSDVILGDGGRFAYTKAGAHFAITDITTAQQWKDPQDASKYVYPYMAETVDTSNPTDPATISKNIDKIYDAVMATFGSTDLGVGGNDEIHGGDEDPGSPGDFKPGDIILGGMGDDVISGDGGNDIIVAGKGFDEVHGGADADTIFGGDQADVISGDAGNDVISGGQGNDYIHGNTGDDVMKGDAGADVMFGDQDNDQVFGQTEPDILMGGWGNDLVVGGTGDDVMFGDDGVVAKLNHSDGTGTKVIFNDTLLDRTANIDPLLAAVIGSEGNFTDTDVRSRDLILTYVTEKDGNDFMSGDAGQDYMFGGGGNDKMGGDVDPRLPSAGTQTPISQDVMIGDGGMITFYKRQFRSISTVIADASLWTPPSTLYTFDDTIYGDNGNDYIFGGQGNDFLFGGHGKVVTAGVVDAYRGATDAAAGENDILVGDNGRMDFGSETFGDGKQFGDLKQVSTTDVKNETGGYDYVEGEVGNDVIFGGVNGTGSEHDKLFGNEGDDVVLGDDGELVFGYNGLDTSIPHDTILATLDLIRSYRDGLGGTDEVSGAQGNDVLMGGTGGDLMHGDNAAASSGPADGEDIMLGDNGDIFLIGLEGRLKVMVAAMTAGTAVDLITTTDAIDADHIDKAAAEVCGGPDTMSGNANADIILGGVNNGGMDTLYGDRAAPTTATITNDYDDILLGDNGKLMFTLPGGPSYENRVDKDRNTLDLIRSFEDTLGGVDTISGNKGQDVAIGGTAGDIIYGDDASESAYIGTASKDEADMLLGDNADIFLVKKTLIPGASGVDLKVVLDAAVKTIRTTDTLNPVNTGGSDTISGNAKGDIIAGGVYGDTIYGDQATPGATNYADDGDDIILGDNGAFEWLSTGRLGEIHGIDINVNNTALYNKYNAGTPDDDLTTLDLVTTEQPTSGGRDTIYGDQGRDLIFGGTDADTIYGDDGKPADLPEGSGASTNNDLILGDHGRIYPQFSTLRDSDFDWQDDFNSRNFFAINVGNLDGGEGDRMWGEEGDDTMLGEQGDDRMWGGSGNDDMTGGSNVSGAYDELGSSGAIAAIIDPAITVPAIGGAVNDLMDGGTGADSMAGDNAIIWRRGDYLSPRFRLLTKDAIYTTTPDTITTNVGGAWQIDPTGVIGRDIQLIDHSDAVQTTPNGRFGNDVMAGGADNDSMFGELGNDLMQGDGSIADSAVAATFLSYQIGVADSGSNPDTDETLYFNIPELSTDADDYMEGNGGSDLMYGGLGQDDMIGGSSALFGLDTEDKRPDTTDYIFGGAGIAIGRNDIGATTFGLASEDGATHVITTAADGHSRDADFIMGDNANVYRLVNSGTDSFLNFNYDNIYGIQIIPRAMQQLDYTLGGGDYAGGGYNALGQATPSGKPADNGAADLIHGESGDDYIFGMTGSDVIFGEGQDDDIVGGYGNDWISGGTGQDGVLGDDGLIRTSRNSTVGEPLYGVAGLTTPDDPKYNQGTVLDELIATPGNIQIATINISGELKKTIDITPFSHDPDWLALDDEFPDDTSNTPFADDIIFGGLGSDFLHGGSGDDAISGAEALEHAYVPVYATDGITPTGRLDLGYNAVGIPSPNNPGDVLAFNSEDLDGRHLNNRFRAGEFRLYDEFDPRRKIQLDATGDLWKSSAQGDAYEFLLNFNETEGVVRPAGTVPKATGQQTETYPQVNDDGRDLIFGDLGNDWLVGGTGRDDLFGGWGNDYLNADDNLNTETAGVAAAFDNESPDTHPYYEDRVYGGAGRDILIGNTGGDRLIDWVGEYNSYLVPYAPFGQASVSRTLMPHLHEFLYALSAGDGADSTRYSDAIGGTPPEPTNNNPIPSRNGEPHGELGLVLQKDFAWQDQTGAPADPQAGNIPGGKRDVLRSAGFNDGTLSGLAVDSGSFTVSGGALQVAADSLGKDATGVFTLDEQLPSYYEFLASIKVDKATAGWKANSYLIFDYFDKTDFKFAGVNISTNKLEMGYHDASGWHVVKDAPSQLKAGISYNVGVYVNGTNVTLIVDNKAIMNYTFGQRMIDGVGYGLNMGLIGLGSDNSRGSFDNVVVQRVPPAYTLQQTEQFNPNAGDLFDGEKLGTWQVVNGRYEGTAAGSQAYSLVNLDIGRGLETNAILDLSGVLRIVGTAGAGGFVFDRYADNDYKFVSIDAAADKVYIGHVSPKGGVKIDVSFGKVINTNTDYTLAVSLKGTSVNVSLNGAVVGGFVFNGVTLDGDFGLLSTSGKISFDSVTVKTNDPAFAAASLTAAAASTVQAEAASWLTYAQLDGIIAEAKDRWAESLGTGVLGQAALDQVTFQIVNFGDLTLGKAIGAAVLIDLDAAGWGWFVDTTPFNDVEFGLSLSDVEKMALETSPAFGRMDLLTVVMHELGHVLGFKDLDPNAGALMSETLDAGTRRLNDSAPDGPALAQMDSAVGGQVASMLWGAKDNKATWLEDFLVDLAGKNVNPFEPIDKIKISIPGVSGGSKKKL